RTREDLRGLALDVLGDRTHALAGIGDPVLAGRGVRGTRVDENRTQRTRGVFPPLTPDLDRRPDDRILREDRGSAEARLNWVAALSAGRAQPRTDRLLALIAHDERQVRLA